MSEDLTLDEIKILSFFIKGEKCSCPFCDLKHFYQKDRKFNTNEDMMLLKDELIKNHIWKSFYESTYVLWSSFGENQDHDDFVSWLFHDAKTFCKTVANSVTLKTYTMNER